MSIARASLGETQYFIHLFQRLDIFTESQAKGLTPIANQAGSLLYGLIRSLAAKLQTQKGPNTYMIKETPDLQYGAIADRDFDLSNLNP